MGILGNPTLRLFIGAALISLSPVWVKLVSVSPTTSGFYRVLIGGLALAAYLAFSGQRLQLSRRTWQILLLAAVFFALDLWFWHRSIYYIGPGLATLLANFQVFIMTAAGIVLLRESPRPLQLFAIPLAVLGLALIVGLDWRHLPEDYRLGVIFGLLTAASYAGYLLTLRRSRQDSIHRLPTREVAIISLVTAGILGLSALVEGESLTIPGLDDAVWLVCYGILSHCIGWMFIASSLPHVSTAEAGIALLLQPTLSFVWDVLFFARVLTATELAGAGIALVAIYLGSRPASKQTQSVR
ncbi:MAG: DMT family transporter [Gammaproteobacteria bacterium]|nr:DMT family transporter [Gammaproteobacteria bacterium]MDH3362847.1 DMT family transporter [Gammaproteobacteria bacterium]